MPDKFDELKRKAEKAAREIDDKFQIKSRLDRGARVAGDAVRRGARAASDGLDAVREEAARIDREHQITDRLSRTARGAVDAAVDAVKDSGAREKAEEFAGEVRDAAGDIYGEAREYYRNATGAARAGASAARLPSSVLNAASSARKWIRENPGTTAIVSLALVAGTRAGSALPALDVALLGSGAAGHWLFHSAVIPYGLRRLTDKYDSYLKKQEELVEQGKLSEAEAARVRFERDVAKYVGAPLLGAFSVAAGGVLLYEAFTGAAVTGAPVSLLLGGNPLLTSIWFFGNGLVCIHSGYRFFMMALGDQDEVTRLVRDIKGLLPEPSTAESGG